MPISRKKYHWWRIGLLLPFAVVCQCWLSAARADSESVRRAALALDEVSPAEDSTAPIGDRFGDVSIPRVKKASHQQLQQPAEPIEDPFTNDERQFSDDSGDGGMPGCATCGPSTCGLPGCAWLRTEYLYWWTEGTRLPPLVTTGPSANQPGFLGSPGTEILFGNGRVNGFGRSGGRVIAGAWLDPCQTFGIEGDYFMLASAVTDFSATSPGSPILSRPFFDVRPTLAAENVEQVASPGVLAGTINVHVPTQFQSASIGFRHLICCNERCMPCSDLPGLNGPAGYRLDFLLGYRFYRLYDGVAVTENLQSLSTDLPGSFLVNDTFTTRNHFNGAEFGTSLMTYRGRWSFEFLSRLALGNNSENVTINGSTATTQNGTTTVDQGGLLALSSNIGHYHRSVFAVVPQLNTNLTYQLTPRLRATFGYTFIYWSRLARAANQIDTDVNSTLLPNSPNPPAGDLRHPQFVFHDTDFWAQGINAGLEYRW